MFRITIREMFWLSTVIALAIGWTIHTRSEQTNDQFLQIQLMEQRLHEANELVTQMQSISKNKSEAAPKQME
jgi:hypothetical protein